MATGYTDFIKESNVTFEQFATRCMRAFGACVMQREDSLDIKPAMRVADNDFHIHCLRRAYKNRHTVKHLTPSQISHRTLKKLQTDLKYHTKAIKDAEKLRKEYTRLLNDVNNWQAPTPDHIRFKEFMTEQLSSSITFDCGTEYHSKEIRRLIEDIINFSPESSRKELLKMYDHDVEYAHKHIKEENDRVTKANDWMTAVFNSIQNKNTTMKTPSVSG